MIVLDAPADLDWRTFEAVVYAHRPVRLTPAALARVAAGRERFEQVLAAGAPCYGVTTGLGRFTDRGAPGGDDAEFAMNVLRARAAATGPPLPAAVARGTLLLKLANCLSGLDGVRPSLVEALVARLNDGFTPWIPGRGHGMAADTVAHTHAFQTLAGEGYVLAADASRQCAGATLRALGAQPYRPDRKEALALVSGLATSPAYAIHACRHLLEITELACLVAALSMAGAAVPRDPIEPAAGGAAPRAGTRRVMAFMRAVLRGCCIPAHTLQAPVSFRVVAPVHGALLDALDALRAHLEQALPAFSGNPLLADGRLLSIGAFHDQHLVNQVEHVALALAQAGCLSERRLHRLLDPVVTGLGPQLAPRPGLDAGLVVAHKAALALVAELKVQANPLSLHTGDTSLGQEDFMTLSLPAIARLFEMAERVRGVLAYELLAVLTALDGRRDSPGELPAAIHAACREVVPRLVADRAPGPDAERLLALLAAPPWCRSIPRFG